MARWVRTKFEFMGHVWQDSSSRSRAALEPVGSLQCKLYTVVVWAIQLNWLFSSNDRFITKPFDAIMPIGGQWAADGKLSKPRKLSNLNNSNKFTLCDTKQKHMEEEPDGC